ncbi:hypothetical protein [Asticcacaulis sp. AND118]|uniref:hypothetical protein n=1 Tax=Asticcacaulis sp. AND118 TaxID=2840468 RepID=UPI001CFF6B58|nr:hypothetical protein [Asticcacaulis sp. AND118]UDF04249.1 hypothetical protein LH365_04195 [Asticcacaulis sp. AND118]
MKPLLCLIGLSLPLMIALPAQAAPAPCRAEAMTAVRQTAAYRHGSVREKQALLRSHSLVRACDVKA